MTNISKTLGYGGSATIYGIQVLITSGSFEQTDSPATLEMLDLPSILDTPQKRSRVKHAPGTSQFTGSVSFDVDQYAIDNLVRTNVLMERNFEYSVGITDGNSSWVMDECLTTGLSVSGAPGGLISASLSFMSVGAREEGPVTNDYKLDYDSDPANQPGAYWWSGAEDVRDWTLSFSQAVTPMYGNTSSMSPQYLLAGLSSYTLVVTTYSEIEHNSVDIMTRSFTLSGFTTSKSYSFNGPTDLGMYAHTFETAAIGVSNNTIIT